MVKDKKKRRIHSYRQIELLFWLLVLLFVFTFGFFIHTANKNSYEFHNIFLSDVDGIIVGSPVNLMGVPIGYITKIKIVDDDEIFVRFIIKDKSIKLPKGVIANVEFSGMAGSKSLELYPPDPEYVKQFGLNPDDYIIIARSQRLQECWSLLYDIFNNIGAIPTRITIFTEKFKSEDIDTQKSNAVKDIDNFLEFYSGWVNNMQKEIEYYESKIHKNGVKKGNIINE